MSGQASRLSLLDLSPVGPHSGGPSVSANHSIDLSDDSFVRSIIQRKVGRLIAKSDFTQQDRGDLVQEVYVRATKSLRLYDPSVGHLYPYVCTVVQRHLANVIRDRLVAKRSTAGRVSLSKMIRDDQGGQVECLSSYTSRIKIDGWRENGN